MKKADTLIIGAGAAGLMAAHTLAKAGRSVIVLEARSRLGGRIFTLDEHPFFKFTELGAEFVHGNLPVTSNLLKEAGLGSPSANAEMWRYKNGEFKKNEQFIEGWDKLMERLNALKVDISINDFLQKEFPQKEYQELRDSTFAFVSGYDTADPNKASSFALRNEWQSEDEEAQHRVEGGYGAMINYLARECKANGGQLFLNEIVKEVNWRQDTVEISTSKKVHHQAQQIIIAVPLGVLQAEADSLGAITFNPALPNQLKAIKQLGFGAVIKFLFQFDEIFWETERAEQQGYGNLKKMGYLFSDEVIPTWWTQFPAHVPLLTGWIGGPEAAARKDASDEELLDQGLQSLSNIFDYSLAALKKKLVSWKIVNWTADPFTRGSYAYDTTESLNARKILTEPMAHKGIHFAGDAFYEGSAMGTVEAALASGLTAAKKIIDSPKLF